MIHPKTGYTAGSWYQHSGAASNFLCLPKSPEWGFYQDTFENQAFIFGTEYETNAYKINKETLNSKLHDQDVPCAVCQSKLRSSKIMIPAKKSCMDGWHKEYRGYLMAGYHSYSNGATEYICVDANPDKVHGGGSDQNGRILYPVEARCGSLKCPPYVNNRELTCVVCSR
ncbi:hypothetical protein KUTeg_004244 [Tegillarca granosa]|uniref:Short-chain collagen C4-like n=1 Tax=Tegillarca granosa TaxID=220873 RepID=A0ABQ9FTW9_TEGGR|nr:hypothetical protein KUTeg_004244 [Tegillarca granosa]